MDGKIPLIFHLSSLGPVSCVFTSCISWGAHRGERLQSDGCWMADILFPSWIPSGLTSSPSMVAAVADNYDILYLLIWQEIVHSGFPDSSVGKCSAGDSSSIPELGRSAGEGIGCPLQYSWASLVAWLVKNLPAVWETWVQSLGWEDPLEKGKAPTPVFWLGEFHGL